ncbi:potassium voltage-gated channel protein egl-36-like isoform X1 [Haliotis rubra]|uniref:potassium voltage-gated channel protein egl-36-like isoform X1 n=2 Tax=Haliotis rubra TaxID=36100 RepID=UPI001EE5ED79|nr:potassium voltage-gated channel protein egl-36-like isoform X1 [Haliotis rubra]
MYGTTGMTDISPADVTTTMERVRICVGGTHFVTTRETLNKYPRTPLAELNKSCDNFDDSENEYYFDRDPAVFACILNMYRTKELHVTQALCGNAVRNELEFWKIPETVIAPCCWRTLHQVDQDKEILDSLNKGNMKGDKSEKSCHSWRFRVWRCMEQPNSSLTARIWNVILALMILLASIVYCLDTEPGLRIMPENGTDEYWTYRYAQKTNIDNRILLLIFTDYNKIIYIIDFICLLFFSAELVVHLLVCPILRLFFCSIINWIDILTVLIGWSVFVLEEGSSQDLFEDVQTAFYSYMVFKSLYAIRIFRIFRLMQSNSNLRIIFLSLMECKRELILLVLSFFILATIFGSFEYFCEGTNSKFESIPLAIWWALVTMTTVGYGDMYPTTTCGYAVGSVCALFGVLALTLPVAVIATHFSDYYTVNQWRSKAKKRKQRLLSGECQSQRE